MWGLVELSWLSGRGESEGSPDPTVCDEESEKIEVGDEERNEVGESCEDDDVAGNIENENGMASDGDADGDWDSSRDLDGDRGEGDRDVVTNKDCMGAEEGASVGEADVDSDVDTSVPSDTVVVIDVSSCALVVGAAAVVVVNCPLL